MNRERDLGECLAWLGIMIIWHKGSPRMTVVDIIFALCSNNRDEVMACNLKIYVIVCNLALRLLVQAAPTTVRGTEPAYFSWPACL